MASRSLPNGIANGTDPRTVISTPRDAQFAIERRRMDASLVSWAARLRS